MRVGEAEANLDGWQFTPQGRWLIPGSARI